MTMCPTSNVIDEVGQASRARYRYTAAPLPPQDVDVLGVDRQIDRVARDDGARPLAVLDRHEQGLSLRGEHAQVQVLSRGRGRSVCRSYVLLCALSSAHRQAVLAYPREDLEAQRDENSGASR